MYGPGGYSGAAGYGAQQGAASTGYGTSGYTMAPMSNAGSSFGNYANSFSMQPAYIQPAHANHSINGNFLADNRPWTPIISSMGEVQEIVEKAYGIITGQEFPHDSIKLMVCDEKQFKDIHMTTGGAWNPGIMGFSFNKYGRGVSEIYVRQDNMDSILLTIGHELGHVLGPTLPNPQDEEAKAHAFSIAWIETIREHNIGGLQPNIIPNPAQNGLHDVAFDYVKYLLQTGTKSFDVFKTLAHGLTSIIAQT